jgi:hypothetical protein
VTTSIQIAAALRQVELAYGQLTLPDWQQHAFALADAIRGLSDVYMHIDAKTGQYESEPIYLDPQRTVLGLIPRAVEPLVRLLATQTQVLDSAIADGWRIPDTEVPAWAHWHDRLARYVAVLEKHRSALDQPSEQLWREVTAPLLQGIYPADFAKLGIVNPNVPSKPDVGTVPTTAFMVALETDEVGVIQAWLLSWREGIGTWMYEAKAAITSVLAAAGEGVREGTRKVARGLTVAVLTGGALFIGWQALQSGAAQRRANRRR